MAFPRFLAGNERRIVVEDYTAPHPISQITQQAIDIATTRVLAQPTTGALRWGEKFSLRAGGDLGMLQRWKGLTSGVTPTIAAGLNTALPATSEPAFAASSVKAIISQAGMTSG